MTTGIICLSYSKAALISLATQSPSLAQFFKAKGLITKIKVDRRCRLIIDDEEIQVLDASKLTKVPLPKGEYIRKVVDIENDKNFNEDVLVLEHERAELIRLDN